MEKIHRLHYRAQLKENYTEEQLKAAVSECMEKVRHFQKEGRILTAALYRYGKMLFLYYEALGEALQVTEPFLAEKAAEATMAEEAASIEAHTEALLESGEDVQASVVYPVEFLAALSPYLQVWPGQKEDRLWVHMYYIYCHSLPESREQWKRAAVPEMRRGRIAFVRDEKLFSYVYYHKAIVDEGLLLGDKYQSIALHENILFSYFEEPKTETNMKKKNEPSSVINEWLAVDPESHFIHVKEGNFMFIPALFAMGAEDLETEVQDE